jgi:hypothetical protein
MAKKLKQSLVPEGVDYTTWVCTASVKDLVAEMTYQNEKLLEDKPKKKKNA